MNGAELLHERGAQHRLMVRFNGLVGRMGLMRKIAATLGIAIILSACSPSPSRDPAEAASLAAAIQQQLAENFGMPGYETSWYSHIKTVTVEDSTLVIGTDLTSRTDAASSVCGGGSNWVFTTYADPRLTSLEVRGPSGQVLIHRGAVSDSC